MYTKRAIYHLICFQILASTTSIRFLPQKLQYVVQEERANAACQKILLKMVMMCLRYFKDSA